MITVSEIMNTEVITLKATDSISIAASVMTENNIRHLPIVDTHNQVIGIISQRDVLRAGELAGENKTSKANTISDIMSKDILTIHPKDSLKAAGLTLQKHKYGCLPVIENKLLVGIITDSDFVAVAINLIEKQDDIEDNY